jgi:hypothetical protein
MALAIMIVISGPSGYTCTRYGQQQQCNNNQTNGIFLYSISIAKSSTNVASGTTF